LFRFTIERQYWKASVTEAVELKVEFKWQDSHLATRKLGSILLHIVTIIKMRIQAVKN